MSDAARTTSSYRSRAQRLASPTSAIVTRRCARRAPVLHPAGPGRRAGGYYTRAAMSTVLASAADARYGHWLLNLLGSLHANAARDFDAVVVYDLGLSADQRRLVHAVRGVEVRTVPEFVPHWRQGFAWKPWIWTHLEADRLVYLDAGTSLLRPLDEALAQIDDRGYWLVSQGHPLAEIVPSDYWELYGVPRELGDRVVVAAGIIGFVRHGRFYEDVVVPTYEDCLAGRSLGFSDGDLEQHNYGLNATAAPIVRSCLRFRWDQTVLNLRLRAAYEEPFVNELERWAGTSPDAHPEQVIWAHRRSGDLRFLPRIRYRFPDALWAVPVTLRLRMRWWLMQHRWLFRASTYVGKARGLYGRGK